MRGGWLGAAYASKLERTEPQGNMLFAAMIAFSVALETTVPRYFLARERSSPEIEDILVGAGDG